MSFLLFPFSANILDVWSMNYGFIRMDGVFHNIAGRVVMRLQYLETPCFMNETQDVALLH